MTNQTQCHQLGVPKLSSRGAPLPLSPLSQLHRVNSGHAEDVRVMRVIPLALSWWRLEGKAMP